MQTSDPVTQQRPVPAGEEASARVAREDVIIAKAEADIEAGLGIEDLDVEAWLDALEHDPERAPPQSPRNGQSPHR